MTKQDFIAELRAKLSGLPKQDVEDRLNFYSEMIDDRIEEGVTEEEAVLRIGAVDVIASQIVADIPLAKIAKQRIKPKRRLKAWEIVLLALGSPIWFSLLVAAFAVILALYASVWSVIVSLWSVFAAFVGCAVGGVLAFPIMLFQGNALVGIVLLGAGLLCAGLAILMFFGCLAATKGVCILTKKIVLKTKKCLVRKESVS